MERREVLKTMAVAGLVAGAGGYRGNSADRANRPLCWSTAPGLAAGAGAGLRTGCAGAGHRVFTPTQTGLGERKHLLSKDITLDTFTKDIVNVLEAEELTNIVLVGHSFGGLAISGVADAMPERIRHLVYLELADGGGRQESVRQPAGRCRRRAPQGRGGNQRWT